MQPQDEMIKSGRNGPNEGDGRLEAILENAMNATVKSPAPSHRQRLLKEGLRHFYATGFHGTSVDDLLAAAEAPKGSFYHHFGSKDEFAKAVIAEYSAGQMASLNKFASR